MAGLKGRGETDFGFFGCGLQLVKEEGEGERSEERRGREATSLCFSGVDYIRVSQSAVT